MATSTLVAAKSGEATLGEQLRLYKALKQEFGEDTHIVISLIPSNGAYCIECFVKNAPAIFQRARELAAA